MVLPVLVVFATSLVWGLLVMAAQIQCVDAARTGARAAARQDPADAVLEVTRATAPRGAEVTISREGDQVRVVVVARPPALRGLPFEVREEAVAAAEEAVGTARGALGATEEAVGPAEKAVGAAGKARGAPDDAGVSGGSRDAPGALRGAAVRPRGASGGPRDAQGDARAARLPDGIRGAETDAGGSGEPRGASGDARRSVGGVP